jgi:hypothetical protein
VTGTGERSATKPPPPELYRSIRVKQTDLLKPRDRYWGKNRGLNCTGQLGLNRLAYGSRVTGTGERSATKPPRPELYR